MAKRTPMRPDGVGPDPRAIAVGNLAPDREGEVLKVILSGALPVAVDAALRAGRMLREEFHRSGGPRGGGSHAEIDSDAERVVRETLTGAYPDWAYLGEETGHGGPGDAEYRWLVDPNDGTKSYLKGLRGDACRTARISGWSPGRGSSGFWESLRTGSHGGHLISCAISLSRASTPSRA